MDGPLTFTVPEEADGERIDKFLAQVLEVSRSVSRELIEQGVTVDGSPAKASDRLAPGASVVAPAPSRALVLEPEEVAFEVVYEDPSVVVVDKPPGLVVHPGSGRRRGTLASGLLHRYPDIEGVGAADRWGLVHRLDRDTSGVILVARTQSAYDSLRAQMADRRVSRVYDALVHGVFGIPTGTIEAPIGRDPSRPTRRAVVATGKDATTHYSVLREYPDWDVSRIRVTLDTGRTHQIRVHMTAIEHPVVGDRQYGARPSRVETPRIFLHASVLGFTHPDSGERVEVDAALPEDLVSVLRSIDD